MRVDILSQAGKLLKEQRQYRRRAVVFLCLAVIVAFGTVTALKLYGQAMTHKMEVLDCGYEVHEHTEKCYERDGEGNLGTEPVCGYADYVVHVHNDKCYDGKGNLVCALEEHQEHKHTEECYVTEMVLVCGEEAEDAENTDGAAAGNEENAGETEMAGTTGGTENADSSAAENTGNADGTAKEAENTDSIPAGSAGAAAEEPGAEAETRNQTQEPNCEIEAHRHTEVCYEKVPVCGYGEEHIHDADCIIQEIACGLEEHMHGDGCCDADGNVICEKAEHAHMEECYTVAYVCEKEEHIHLDACYTETLTCTAEEHEHTDACSGQGGAGTASSAETQSSGVTEVSEVSEPTADSETPEGAGSAAPKETAEPEAAEGSASGTDTARGHVHTEACYEEVTRLVCGELELHTHDDSCYGEDCFDEEGNLIEGSVVSCGLLQLEEHTHEGDCFKVVELTPEEVAALNSGAKLHIHEDSCYDMEGRLICGHESTHIHTLECYDDAGNLICGYGEETKSEFNCGKEEHSHSEECLNEEGAQTCGMEEHTHDETCLEENVYRCGMEKHVHEPECYDAEGNLACETEEHTHSPECLLTEEEREEIEKVNQLIAGLPSGEEIAQKIAEYEETGEDGEEAFDEYMAALLVQIQEAYDAYLVLDEALREHVEGAECLSALWELMETVWLGDVPDTVPEYAAFLPVGDQGGGMVLELLYGDEKTHAEEPYGKENYTNYEMQGLFKLYTTGIQGNTTIDQVTMSLYFPKAYMDKEQIRIKEFPESIGKHEISAVTEESRDGEEYYKISITFTDYVPTGALKLPFVMKFKVAEVPADYQLKIFGTIESGEGEEKKADTTAENIYRPKYNKPVITKYVNTNKYESMKEDYTRVAARVGEDGILKNDQYVSFWYKLGDAHWTLRAYNKITLTDRLPQYVDYGGNTRYAVFDSEANPGWTLNEDGISVSRVFEVEEGLEPEKYDNTLMLQIEAAELKLQFPGCKIDEPDKDNFLTKNLTNHVGAVCEPVRPSKGENEDACEDDLIFTLTTQPGAEGSFTKGNSADTVMDTPDTRSGGYMWTLAFENKGASPLVNIVLGDEEIDQRLKFQCVMFRDTLLKELDYVEAFTYDGGTDIYNLKDSEQYGDYFKNTGHNGSLGGIVWKLELDSGREYKGFKVHFREGCELKSGEGITVWPFSTFRKPEEKHFIRDEGRDSENIYKNRAYVAYQEKGSEDGTTHFLFSENKFKLIDTFEKVWIEKEMYYGDNGLSQYKKG